MRYVSLTYVIRDDDINRTEHVMHHYVTFFMEAFRKLYKPDEARPNSLAIPDVLVQYKIITVARSHMDAARKHFPHFKDFGSVRLSFGDIDEYVITGFIGTGRFSAVFCGVAKSTKQVVAVKAFRPVSIDCLKREIFFLRAIRGLPNVSSLIDIVCDKECGTISHVCDFLPGLDHRRVYKTFTLEDIRYYMHELLLALNGCHSRGIMHRDVKPGNMLIDHDTQRLRLIDWGLAELYFPKKPYSTGMGTLRYQAPELIMGYRYYDYGIDVWAAGVTFGDMLVKYPFFEVEYVQDLIREMCHTFTNSAILVYAERLGVEIGDGFLRAMPSFSFTSWQDVVDRTRADMRDSDALDLLRRMLTVDHTSRITAEEALSHPFFAPLKDTET